MMAMLRTSARRGAGVDAAVARTGAPSCGSPRGASTGRSTARARRRAAVPPARQRRLHDAADAIDEGVAVLIRAARDRLADRDAHADAPGQREHVAPEELPRLVDGDRDDRR